MSGDAQPRKRNKDKKRKRDDEDLKETRPSGVHSLKMGPDDIQLHVHSDHGTGGHWCAKIFFFSLMAILLGLIGLILLENRGLADLDTPLSESRFADMLEGWVDEERDFHDEHDTHNALDNSHEHDDDDDNSLSHEEHDQAVSDGHLDDSAEDENDEATQLDENDDDNEDDDNEELDKTTENDDEDDDDDEDDEKEQVVEDSGENNDDDDEDTENDQQNNTENDENLISSINPKLTCDDVNTNPSVLKWCRTLNETPVINKRHIAVNEIRPDVSEQQTVVHVTASQLEKQVDDLVENYNKLAKTLNRSSLMEKISVTKKNLDNESIDQTKLTNYKNIPNSNQKDEENDDEHNEQNDDDDDEDDVDNRNEADNEVDDDDHSEHDEDGDDDDKNNTNDIGIDIDGNIKTEDATDDNENDADGDNANTETQENEDNDESSSHNEEPKELNAAENEMEENINMKRRWTLVTAEEPIPSDDDDIECHAQLVDDKLHDSTKSDESDTEEYSDDDDVSFDDHGVIDGNDIESDNQSVPMTFEELEALYKPKTATITESFVRGRDIREIDSAKMVGRNLSTEEYRISTNKEEPVGKEEEEEEEEESDEEIEYSENEYEDEDVSDIDDSDLLKRLDEKYGKLPTTTQQHSDHDDDEDIDPTWTKIDRSGPASVNDHHILDDEIRRANERLMDDPKSALIQFESILQTHPSSTEAQYGIAKSLDRLADLNRSNVLLKRAIDEYLQYIAFGEKIHDTEFKEAAERCIERMRFIGEHLNAVSVHEKLIERFDGDPYYRNQLAVTYLLVNKLSDAKYVLHQTLQRWREDGFAAAHYGFVLKNLDNDLETAVIFLRQGIESGADGTNDGRFFFTLGDILIRLGRFDEARTVFKEAADRKLFLSEHQRSLYNVDHLKSRPFWTLAESGYKKEFRTLEQNWMEIRDEGLSVLNQAGYFTNEAENLRDSGVWMQFELFARGKRNVKNCQRTPFTCKLIETFPAARFCKRGQVKFSVMHPSTHVWPHCGPTNCRLRAHLGLQTADNTSLRVATETRTWTEGEIMIFDDSFEHEVWHNGTTVRLILIIDVWHPDLTIDDKKTLVPI